MTPGRRHVPKAGILALAALAALAGCVSGATGPAGPVAANSTVTAVAASPLSPDPALVLVRREGAAGDPVPPLLALEVPLPGHRS